MMDSSKGQAITKAQSRLETLRRQLREKNKEKNKSKDKTNAQLPTSSHQNKLAEMKMIDQNIQLKLRQLRQNKLKEYTDNESAQYVFNSMTLAESIPLQDISVLETLKEKQHKMIENPKYQRFKEYKLKSLKQPKVSIEEHFNKISENISNTSRGNSDRKYPNEEGQKQSSSSIETIERNFIKNEVTGQKHQSYKDLSPQKRKSDQSLEQNYSCKKMNLNLDSFQESLKRPNIQLSGTKPQTKNRLKKKTKSQAIPSNVIPPSSYLPKQNLSRNTSIINSNVEHFIDSPKNIENLRSVPIFQKTPLENTRNVTSFLENNPQNLNSTLNGVQYTFGLPNKNKNVQPSLAPTKNIPSRSLDAQTPSLNAQNPRLKSQEMSSFNLNKISNSQAPNTKSSTLKKEDLTANENVKRNLFRRKSPLSTSNNEVISKEKFSNIESSSKKPMKQEAIRQIDSHSKKILKEDMSYAQKFTNRVKSIVNATCKGVQLKISGLKSLVSSTKDQAEQNNESGEILIDNNLKMDKSVDTPDESYLHSVRNLVCPDNNLEAMECEFSNYDSKPAIFPGHNTVYFVVDTNIFVQSLNVVKRVKERKIRGMNVILIIPWQVLKELDYLKDSKSNTKANTRARIAINYLWEALTSEDPSIRGQSSQHSAADVSGFKIEVPDDHLIKCCLQLRNEGHTVVLLTNDKNLSLRAFIQRVPSVTESKLTRMLDEESLKSGKNDHPFEQEPNGKLEMEICFKTFKLTTIFKEFLNSVTEIILKEKYNDLWLWFAPSEPPWNLKSMLNLLDEAISSAPNPDQHLTIKYFLNKLQDFLKNNNYYKLTEIEAEEYGKLCHFFADSLGVFFQELVEEYGRKAAFFKNKSGMGPPPGSTYRHECCLCTIRHFEMFIEKLVGYCNWLSVTYQLALPPLPPLNFLPNGQISDCKKFRKGLILLMESLQSVCSVPAEELKIASKGINEIYTVLKTNLGDNCEPDFSEGDVFEFARNVTLRPRIPPVLEICNTILVFLSGNGL